MEQESKLKDPGITLTAVLTLYAVFVFAWWPTDIYLFGITLVAWLMFIGLVLWFILSVIYVAWIERIEKKDN